MSLREGGKHGAFGLVSAVLALKVVVVKGLVFLDDLLFHQLLKAPIELMLYELPVSLFGTVGRFVVWLTGTELPPAAVGMVVAYPLLVVGVVVATHGPNPRTAGSYWLGATIITGLSVAASLGIAPDPAGAGSTIAYHLEHHTVAHLFRRLVLGLGEAIGAVAGLLGFHIDETIGLVVAIGVLAVGYGFLWERHVGHE